MTESTPTPITPHFCLDEFLRRICHHQHGYLTKRDLDALAQATPQRQLLVKWHQGRALMPAQDVAPLIKAAAAGGWVIRDVSLPASDPAQISYSRGTAPGGRRAASRASGASVGSQAVESAARSAYHGDGDLPELHALPAPDDDPAYDAEPPFGVSIDADEHGVRIDAPENPPLDSIEDADRDEQIRKFSPPADLD